MEDKYYYTPTIEEFYVGFEFEYLSGIDEEGEDWSTRIFDQLYENYDFPILDVGEKLDDSFRVKYLDQSDIESLGWKLEYTKNSPFTGKDLNTYKVTKEYGFNTGTTYTLEQLDNNFYLIKSETYSSYGSEVYRMSFTILNKSELKKLMQQLGING